MRRSTLIASLTLALLPVACAPESVQDAPPPALAPVLGVDRIGNAGPFLAGATERFGLRFAPDFEPAAVRWSASAGDVVQEGLQARWRLPEVLGEREAFLIAEVEAVDGSLERVTYAFTVREEPELAFRVNAAARGQVDPGPEATRYCDLAIDNSDVPHVVYQNTQHQQLVYARFINNAWTREVVDGPGFDIGGTISTQMAVAVSATGVPHIAYYSWSDRAVWYATKSGNSWIRERVSNTFAGQDFAVAVALDPANGGRATIGYTGLVSSRYRTVIAYRAGAGAWTEDGWAVATTDEFLGAMAFRANGTLVFAYDRNDLSYAQWNPAQSFHGAEVLTTRPGQTRVSLTLDNQAEAIIVNENFTYHRVQGSWITTAYDVSSSFTRHGVGYHAGRPKMAVRHGDQVEVMETNSEGYWLYTRADDASDDWIGFALDSAGDAHFCYTKSNSIWFW